MIPKICQLCDCDVTNPDANIAPANMNQIVDGKTSPRSAGRGSWAYMCVPCHKANGVGLGIGLGQRFDVRTGSKLEG